MNTPHIIRFCATSRIAMTVQEAPTTITIQLDGAIYSEGFNVDTFLKSLDTLNTCVEKIHTLIPGIRNDRHSPVGYVCRTQAETSRRSHKPALFTNATRHPHPRPLPSKERGTFLDTLSRVPVALPNATGDGRATG